MNFDYTDYQDLNNEEAVIAYQAEQAMMEEDYDERIAEENWQLFEASVQ